MGEAADAAIRDRIRRKKDLGEKAQPVYDYTARTYFAYDALMRALPDQKKTGDDYTPGLKTISKETFEDKAVILLTSPTGAAGLRNTVVNNKETYPMPAEG